MTTHLKTFNSVFKETIGVHPSEVSPGAHLIDDLGATEEQIHRMFDGFSNVMMPLVGDREKHWELMKAGMEISSEGLEHGKLKDLNIAAGGPWTRQRVSALIAVWHNELPGEIGSG